MTLNKIGFETIFLLIQFTPNLEYLNVHSSMPSRYGHQISINKSNIKLKQIYLTLHGPDEASNGMDQFTNYLKQFSSSLICLSLNLVNAAFRHLEEVPFYIKKLQQFLESMKELKEFHLYAKIHAYSINSDLILSEFRTQFWFDHNWSFGTHDNYFYTLPFHFDYLYEFYNGFMRVRSKNPDILYNPRIWYNVKSIELERTYDYDRNFVKELKIKMPKLCLIKFGNRKIFPERYSSEIEDKREKIDLRLDNVTTIQFTRGLIGGESYRIISSLPNLRHLIFCCGILYSNNELSSILNEKIQRLDIDISSPLKHLTEKSYVYFSNIQYINFCLSHFKEEPEWYADN
jgi:hypothetical protein